jgi:N-acetylglucosaminyl-diphospho-decaprenol L-rhamnosyltransferase
MSRQRVKPGLPRHPRVLLLFLSTLRLTSDANQGLRPVLTCRDREPNDKKTYVKIAGVFVNYRTADLTIQAVNALLNELRPWGTYHVFVVENDSRDGSLAQLTTAVREFEAWRDHVSVLAAPRNGGYGYGINLAVRKALEGPDVPDYFYVINTDAFADPGSIATLVRFMDAHADVGMGGSRVHGPDGVTQGAAFRFPGVLGELEQAACIGLVSRLLRGHMISMPTPTQNLEVDWLPGTSMLIRREVFDRGVFFDEDFFLYFEEVDFARRMRDAGLRAYYVADAPITHIGSVSTGLAEQSRPLPDYWFDSRHRYFLKHHGAAYTAASDAAWVAGHLAFRLKRALLRRPDVLRHRLLRDFIRAGFRELVRTRVHPGEGPSHPGPGHDPGHVVPDSQLTASELGLSKLVAEDFATNGRNPFDPGFCALLAHRLGRRSRGIRSAPARRAARAVSHGMFIAVDWCWGINLPESVEVGRRVRLWHGGGGMLLGARAIGNDVQIRHDTTLGPLRGSTAYRDALPTIEEGAVIGSGVSVLGKITVGRRAVVTANSLVLRDVQPDSTMVGVPARSAQA